MAEPVPLGPTAWVIDAAERLGRRAQWLPGGAVALCPNCGLNHE